MNESYMKHQWQRMKECMGWVGAPWWERFCHVFVWRLPQDPTVSRWAHRPVSDCFVVGMKAGGQLTIGVHPASRRIRFYVMRDYFCSSGSRGCITHWNIKGKMFLLCILFEKVLQISQDQRFCTLLHSVENHPLPMFPLVSPPQSRLTIVFSFRTFRIITSFR